MYRLKQLRGMMPNVIEKAWKQGISYHHTLDAYDALPKQALKITCQLVNAYAPAENESIHFDSLLTYLVANDVRTPALNIDGKVFPLPLDLLWISPEGYPLWACSDLKPESWHQESVDWWHKRLSSVHLIDWSSNPNIKNVGRNKDYRVPLRTVLTDKLVAYAIGNKAEIERLLIHATHIGKKRSQGFGRVTNWQVEAFEGDGISDLIQSNRPLPLEFLGFERRGVLGGWTPPYWDRRRFKSLL